MLFKEHITRIPTHAETLWPEGYYRLLGSVLKVKHAEQVTMHRVLLHWTEELICPTQRWKRPDGICRGGSRIPQKEDANPSGEH